MMPPGGMSPEMMKLAMEQMKNMTPEQMEAMKQQVSQMSPDAIQNAMNMMNNADPEEVKRQMASTQMPSNIEGMKQSVNAFEQHTKDQLQYKYNAAVGLKTQGNSFFSSGQYAEAREKYGMARKNLNGLSSLDARKLHRTCLLNDAACCLHLKQYDESVKICTMAITNATNESDNPFANGQDLKAFYRRGQGYYHLGKQAEACKDLERAHAISPGDEGVSAALEKAKEALAAQQVESPQEKDQAGPQVEEVQEEAEGGAQVNSGGAESPKVEEVEEGQVEEIETPAAEEEAPSSFLPERTAAAMPEAQVKAATEQMKNMSDDDLMRIGKMSGLPDGAMNPDMVRMAMDSMSKMKPEEIQQMAKLSAEMKSTMGGANAATTSMPSTSDPAQAMKMMKENPEMLKQATNMMSAMSEEDLKTMAKMSGMPEDAMKPEMMKAAADALGKMKPEDLEKISELAADGGGMAGASGLNKAQKATEVLSGMSAESLVAVSKEMGHEMTMGQARMMTKFVSFISALLKMIITIKNFIVGKWFLFLALLVLLIALYMRR